jgi:hypothetical protein
VGAPFGPLAAWFLPGVDPADGGGTSRTHRQTLFALSGFFGAP